MSKQNSAYTQIVGQGAGIRTTEIEIDHALFTDGGSTTGSYTITDAVPANSIGLGSYIETLEGFNVAVTASLGNTAGEDEWTAGAVTAAVTTAGTKIMSVYGTTPAVISSEQDVFVTLTHSSDFTLVTSGKIKVRLIYIATDPM
jgi:hypothetical protein